MLFAGDFQKPVLLSAQFGAARKGLQATCGNQEGAGRASILWSTDITYLRMPAGNVYLMAIIDWYSRKVLSWRVFNTMDAAQCANLLRETIEEYGCPAIFNTDQGSQFTSNVFLQVLADNYIQVSMDGTGRALDNIRIERL